MPLFKRKLTWKLHDDHLKHQKVFRFRPICGPNLVNPLMETEKFPN